MVFVGWILAIAGFLLMLRVLWMYNPPDENSPIEAIRHPDNIPAIVTGLAGLFSFVCGVNIVKGRDWARWLYTSACVFALFGEIFFPVEPGYVAVFGNMVRGFFLLLLFLPSSNRYFAAPEVKRW